MIQDSTHDYDDIIDLPHPNPQVHTRMEMIARAAQFMPFAALKSDNEEEEIPESSEENIDDGVDEYRSEDE